MKAHTATALGLAALAVAVASVTAPALAAPANCTFTLSPENSFAITGSGTAVLNGTQPTVSLTAAGLVPNQVHPDHLRGLIGAAAPSTTVAPPTADTSGDGFVDRTEGAPFEDPGDLRPAAVRRSRRLGGLCCGRHLPYPDVRPHERAFLRS